MSMVLFKSAYNFFLLSTLMLLTFSSYSDNGIYTIKKGDNLWNIAEKQYGNRHYSRIIELYNNVNATSLKIDQTIAIPELESIFNDKKMGLVQVIKPEMEAILKARKLYMEVEKKLTGLQSQGSLHTVIPSEIKEKLIEGMLLVNKAIDGIGKQKNVQIPKKMIGQLKEVSVNLKRLADGFLDDPYITDMVHQNLIQALCNGIYWAKDGYK